MDADSETSSLEHRRAAVEALVTCDHPCRCAIPCNIPEMACALRWALINVIDNRFPRMCRADIVEWALRAKEWEELIDSADSCEQESHEIGSCWCGKFFIGDGE